MNSATVLIVDDDTDLQDVVAMILKIGHYGSARAENGTTALAALSQVAQGQDPAPCLVLLDLMLPDMRGEDVYQGMQALALPSLPVVVMSAATEGPVRARQLGLPFLAKPFTLEALLATVARHRTTT